MRKHLVIASFVVLASQAFADPVLVQIEQPPVWPILARLDRPHAEDDAPAAIERWAPEEPRHARHHRHRRHR